MKVLRDAVVAAEAVERKYEAPADVRAAFAALPKAADEVGATLVAREAKFSRLAVDNEAVKRYKALSDTIARQERELRDSTHESSKAQSEFSQRLNEFDSDLDHEIRQINVHFVEGMARIQCRGEVKTSLGDVSAGSGRRPVHPSLEAPVPASLPPSQDIEEKSLIVKVAYRKDEEMKQLSALSQSGGERVVATMLYMLALQVRRGLRHPRVGGCGLGAPLREPGTTAPALPQAITPLPFRIVDEINQGMDAKNERAVLENLLGTAQAMREAAVMAAASSAAGAPPQLVSGRQLFMVSPKLMPNLTHERTMRSAVVFNGPRVGPGACARGCLWGLRVCLAPLVAILPLQESTARCALRAACWRYR